MSKFKERRESSIYNMRIFHNFVKRELIKQSCDYLKENYGKRNITLLDLAVGRSGDLQKWIDNGIMNVVGFDIDSDSIVEARKRYQETLNQLRRRGIRELPKYEFYVMDLSDRNNLTKIQEILQNKKFDIVSCQFAIHYFFKSSDTLDTFMNIVGSYMNTNGFFIGTTMNGDKIKQMFKTTNVIQNELFKIINKTDANSNTPYNNTYEVSLGKEGDKGHYFVEYTSIEYLVNMEELKKVGDGYNLMYIGTMEFSEWYNTFGKNILSNKEKEFSFLNFSFVFKLKQN